MTALLAPLTIEADAVAVYDVDAIALETVQRATAALGGLKAVHLRRSDAAWPAAAGVEAVAFPSRTSRELRAYAMARIVAVRERLMRDARASAALTIGGVDTVGVALFDWQTASRDALLRDWLCAQIVRAGRVRKLVWITDEGAYRPALVAAALAPLRGAGIDVAVLPRPRLARARLASLRVRNAAFVDGRAAAHAIHAGLRPRGIIPPKRRPRVVFVENYPKTSKVAAAAALEAQRRGDVDVWFLVTRRDTAAALAGAGLDRLHHVEDLAGRGAMLRAVRAQRRAARWASRVDRFVPETGGSAPGCTGPELGIAAAVQWRLASHLTTLFQDVFARLRPDVVATTSLINIFGSAAVAAGRRHGAASYFIQHGLMSHDASEAQSLHDRYLLWGEWDRRQRMRLGGAAERIEVTGAGAVEDALASPPDAGMWPADGSLRVLFLPSRTAGAWVSAANARHQLASVIDAVRGIDGAALAIKVHPSDHSPIFDELAPAAGARVLRKGNAAPMMRSADVVVVATSTAGLEACALDKPVIAIKSEGVPVFEQFDSHGAVLYASDAAELGRHIASVRDDAALRARLEERRRVMNADLFHGLLPGASARIADALARGAAAR